ncbi:hypothetical protein Emed_006203 [Eimeria media]
MDGFEENFEDLLAEAEQFEGGNGGHSSSVSTSSSSRGPSVGGPPNGASSSRGAPQGHAAGAFAEAWEEDDLLDESQGAAVPLEEQLRALQTQRFSQSQAGLASQGPLRQEGVHSMADIEAPSKRRLSDAKRADLLSAACSAAASPLTAPSQRKRRKQQQQEQHQQQQEEPEVVSDDEDAELAAAAAALRPPVSFFDLEDIPYMANDLSSSDSSSALEAEAKAAERASLLPQHTNNGRGGPSAAYLRSCLYAKYVRRRFPAAVLQKAAAIRAQQEQQDQQGEASATAVAAVARGAVRVLPPSAAGESSRGAPVYVQQISREEELQQLAAAAAAVRDNPLPDSKKRPMEEILREVMEQQVARRQETEQLLQQYEERQRQQQQQTHQQQRDAGRQWVDVYRPTKVVDLLTSEAESRSVLRWLLNWRRRIPGLTPKILLLAGPPGCGKTTLLHAAARHFGFDVLEVNASDARSSSQLLPLIKGVGSSGDCFYRHTSSNGSKKKPVLLLLDEIDGLAQQGGASGDGDGGGDTATSGKKETVVDALVRLVQQRDSKDKPLLKRPIACTCNNLYARVLRRLRPVCEVISLSPPPRALVLERLRGILRSHKCAAEPRVLETLLEIVEGDLRAALNALQILTSDSVCFSLPCISARVLSSSRALISLADLNSCQFQKDLDTAPQLFIDAILAPPSEEAGGTSAWLTQYNGQALAIDLSLAAALLAESAHHSSRLKDVLPSQFVVGDTCMHKIAHLSHALALADMQSAAASLSMDHSLRLHSLLPACLFVKYFCVSAAPSRSLYSCPPPALSLYRLAGNMEHQRQACLAATAAAAAAVAASAPAVPQILRESFVLDAVYLLVKLSLPFPFEAGALVGGAYASNSINGSSSNSIQQGPRGQATVSSGSDLLQQLSRLLTGEKSQRLRAIAVGCLYTPGSEPRALRLAAQRAALQTAYGLRLTQNKQETDLKVVRSCYFAAAAVADAFQNVLFAVPLSKSDLSAAFLAQAGGSSLHRLTGVSTTYRLEPPLHLLLCLCDFRIQQQQQQQQQLHRRLGHSSSGNSGGWFVGYRASRELSATGAARGLKDSLSTFRRCGEGGTDLLQQQQQILLQHPLHGVSDAACRLLTETKRLLNLKGTGPTLDAAVLSLWGVHQQPQPLLQPGRARRTSVGGRDSSNSSSSASKDHEQSWLAAPPAAPSPFAAALAALSREEFLQEQQVAAAEVATHAVICKQLFVASQGDELKGFPTRSSATKAEAAGAATAAAAKAAIAANAAAAAGSVLDEPQTPKKSNAARTERAGTSWRDEDSPLRSPFKKDADNKAKASKRTAVFSALNDLLHAPTNGYFSFLQGRCNAVKMPVMEELFL